MADLTAEDISQIITFIEYCVFAVVYSLGFVAGSIR